VHCVLAHMIENPRHVAGVLRRLRVGLRQALVCSVALVIMNCGLVALASTAQGREHSCGRLHGGRVVILRGRVTCTKARRVLSYAATHFSGNGPASPSGWQCFRISGDPHYNGDECISPAGAEGYPRNRIELRYRL
jgi:hypothetical protein